VIGSYAENQFPPTIGHDPDRIEVALKVMRPSKISPDGRLEPMRPTTASGDRKPA